VSGERGAIDNLTTVPRYRLPLTAHRSPVAWTILIEDPRPGWANMARDVALLALAATTGSACLRLYRWEPFCLSFGRHEPASRRYRRERFTELGIDCVRRPTGGRAVWHARELTYAVAAPLHVFGGLKDAYREIHAVLARALERLGAHPLLAPRSALLPPHAGACFAAPVGGEILLLGRKAVGSAQVRQGVGFLQHGSVLLEDDQSLVRELAGAPAAPGGEITLTEALGRPVTFDEAAAAVRAEWTEWVGADAVTGTTSSAFDAPTEQQAERFRDPAWTWSR
jgi:lipoate-protein ligase A